MSSDRITRRATIKAAAVLPLVAAPAASANRPSRPEPALNIGLIQETALTLGIATTRFHDWTNQQVADAFAGQGIYTVQLFLSQNDSNYWKYNGRSDLSDLTTLRCRAIADAYRSAGISIHSIGVYTNLIHPDEAERKANLAYFEAMMKVARAMNVQSLVTEAGHHEPDKPVPHLAYHFLEKVWNQMLTTARKLAQLAERHNVTVLIEPAHWGFFATAKRSRTFLEEVDSPRIRALLDPANLLELNDLEEMFQQLKPWIDCLHAKDRKLHADHGVAAGQGDLDYQKFVTLAAKHTPNAPLILEYVGPESYKASLAHVRNAIRQAGAGER